MPIYRVDFNHDQWKPKDTWESWEIWEVPDGEFPENDATMDEVFEVSSGNYIVFSLYLVGKNVPIAFKDGWKRISQYVERWTKGNCNFSLSD